MSADRPSILDDTTYFLKVHPAITSDLAGFSRAVRALKADPTSEAQAATLLSTANRVVAQSFVVFQEPSTPPKPDTIAGVVASLVALMDHLRRRSDHVAEVCRTALAVHLDYYLTHAPDPATAVLAPPSYAHDFIVNAIASLSNTLFSRYHWRSNDPRKVQHFFDADAAETEASEEARTLIGALPQTLAGWCSNAKSYMLYSLVRETKPTMAVEIGIYGGRSIVPIALALRDNKAGEVTGIETWSAAASTKYRTNISNDFSWSVADYGEVKRSFLRYVLDHGLDNVIRIVEASSDRAHLLLDTIDFIHVDGGHSSFGAAQDIVTYVPKVRQGGIIVFDDIDWATTGPAVEILLDTCRLLHVVESMGAPGVPGCAAFVKL